MRVKSLKFLKSVFWSLLMCILSSGSTLAMISDSNFVELCRTGSLQQISEAIKDGANVNASDDKGRTPLISAVARDDPNPELIAVLINAGVQVNSRTEDGSTALMWAASDSNAEVIEILIKAGADVNAQNSDGLTPLMCAAEYNSCTVVITTLIKAGADVHIRNVDGLTPLMFAAAKNSNPEVITVFVKAGADVNFENTEKWTPLILAAWKTSNPEVITTLMKLGANPRAKDNSGRMAVDYAWGNEKLRNTEAFRELSRVSY